MLSREPVDGVTLAAYAEAATGGRDANISPPRRKNKSSPSAVAGAEAEAGRHATGCWTSRQAERRPEETRAALAALPGPPRALIGCNFEESSWLLSFWLLSRRRRRNLGERRWRNQLRMINEPRASIRASLGSSLNESGPRLTSAGEED